MNLYTLSLLNPTWGIVESKLLPFVSLSRQQKVLNYHFEKDQKFCLYSALLTQMILSQQIGCLASQLVFQSNPQHKPLLLSHPDYHFNFSHTDSMILLGISEKNEIGVDVENIKDAPFDVMPFTFHPEEISFVQSFVSDKAKKNASFYEIWTQKEAYTKYLGTGLIDHLPCINTCSPKLKPYFHTWRQNSCACSAFSLDHSTPRIRSIDVAEVISFYLHS